MNIVFIKKIQNSSIRAITQAIPTVHNRNWVDYVHYVHYAHYAHYGKSIMETGSIVYVLKMSFSENAITHQIRKNGMKNTGFSKA
jgi:hypothetical protein